MKGKSIVPRHPSKQITTWRLTPQMCWTLQPAGRVDTGNKLTIPQKKTSSHSMRQPKIHRSHSRGEDSFHFMTPWDHHRIGVTTGRARCAVWGLAMSQKTLIWMQFTRGLVSNASRVEPWSAATAPKSTRRLQSLGARIKHTREGALSYSVVTP